MMHLKGMFWYDIFRFYVYVGDVNKYITNICILSKQIIVLIICC